MESIVENKIFLDMLAKLQQDEKDKRKAYYEANKDKYKYNDKQKAYYEANKDAIKIKNKAYKTQYNEAQKTNIIECECGSTYQHKEHNRHCKTKKHLNFLNK